MYPQPRYFRDAKEVSVAYLQNISMNSFNDTMKILEDYKIMYNGTMKHGVLEAECFFFMDNITNNKFYEYVTEGTELGRFKEVFNTDNPVLVRTFNRVVELIVVAMEHGLLDRLVPNGVYYLFYRELEDCFTLRVEKTFLVRE